MDSRRLYEIARRLRSSPLSLREAHALSLELEDVAERLSVLDAIEQRYEERMNGRDRLAKCK